MKKIIEFMFGAAVLCLASCMGIDNWDAPDARIHGRVIDSLTGENLLTSQNDWSIRIWETSFTANTPQYQSLPVKQDGTYNNSKLFAGTYDMLPYDGPFWPVTDTLKNVVLKKEKQQDFEVIPYLQIVNFEATLNGTDLTLTCQLKAPVRVDLPNLREIKPFLSLTTFCGNSNYINIPQYNDRRIQINRGWSSEVGSSDISKVYTIGPLPVKSGYTYYVRVGANVTVGSNRYNYSPIVKVVVP
ncbi:MAG: DUF3823 domain-containing protein [Dysgonamonadaceae bacterium]|nr:DUF3823 domain-containing protein [Dysgonamonadaceae bacterium]